MDGPRPVEVLVPATTFLVAGWLIGGDVVGATVGAVVGIALGATASVASHADGDGFTDADRATDDRGG